jgi:hypothetical protein
MSVATSENYHEESGPYRGCPDQSLPATTFAATADAFSGNGAHKSWGDCAAGLDSAHFAVRSAEDSVTIPETRHVKLEHLLGGDVKRRDQIRCPSLVPFEITT